MFAGCSGSKTETGRVYWLNFKPESDQTLQEVAKMYTEETGIDVKIVTAASGTYNQTLLSKMEKEESPTLFVIGNQAAVKEWKDYAVNLKNFLYSPCQETFSLIYSKYKKFILEEEIL